MAVARNLVLGVLGLAVAVVLTAAQAPPAKGPPQEPDTTADDVKTLRAVGIGTDGASLLEYFRKRTLPPSDPKQIQALIRQLGDDDFAAREEAYSSLAVLGAAAATELKQAELQFAKDRDKDDAEVRKRVEQLKQRIETKAEPAVQAAAARLIGRSKPAGAAEVLLAYLPFAVDGGVVDECARALGQVAVTGGKLDPAIVKALGDGAPVKRAAAAEAVVRAGAAEQMPAARALLKDADPQVRLRVALALAPRKEKEAVPVLIDLLADLGPEQLWPAQDLLYRLAGEQAPSVPLGSDATTRSAARDAWQKWYTDHRDKIDLAKLERPDEYLGFTVLVQQTFRAVVMPAPGPIVGGKFRAPGEVMELRPDKQVRWKFDLQTQPVDARVVGENRVLVAEYMGMCVTERDFKGKVLWEKKLNGRPLSVQRLPNGNTFVVMQNQLAEYDRQGNEVFAFQHVNLMRGTKLRNGEVAFIANTGNGGMFTRMEAKTQKILKTFPVNPVFNVYGGIEVLPSGGVLVPDLQRQRVVEYDADGKEVKSFHAQNPLGASRLPNGHTLVAAQAPGRVVEFDRNGREVWSFQADGNVFNAHRR